MIKIVFLGTNGWYDTPTGNTGSILIKCPDYGIIIDAGNGFAKIGQHLDLGKPAYLFLSHYHLDHIIGLHTLNKHYFKKGLTIFGPTGLKKMLGSIIQKPYTLPFNKLPYKTRAIELSTKGQAIKALKNCRITSLQLTHPVPTLGYRFELGGRTIAYCSDTGYCANAVELASGADLLISECAFKRGQSLPQWPHLNPDTAARLAKDAKAKKLILTHFDASLYRTIDERRQAGNQARETFKNTAVASDGITIKL